MRTEKSSRVAVIQCAHILCAGPECEHGVGGPGPLFSRFSLMRNGVEGGILVEKRTWVQKVDGRS